jgi:hypothetical protein
MYRIKARVTADVGTEQHEWSGVDLDVASYDSEHDALRGLARLKDPTYEGWPNRETWAVNLWLNNEEQLYNEVREIVRGEPPQVSSGYEAGKALAEYVEQMALGDDPGASLATDLLIGALARVEWDGIVEGFRED